MDDAKEKHRMKTAVRQAGAGATEAELSNGSSRTPIKVRRINIALAERVYQEALELARETDKSLTELIRIALGVLRIIVNALKQGQRIIITGGDQPDREIYLPGIF